MDFTKRTYLKRLAICIVAMSATCLVYLLLMKMNGFAPFGNDSLAAADCKVQYLDFFNYYKDVLTGDNRIGYSLTKGLGGNGMGLFSYYLASPLNVLMYFFDGTQTNTFIDVLILIKLGLAAAAFAYFLQARLYDRLSPAFTILLSAGYGLSHYSFANGNNVMWLDGMILFPLMLLGTHLVVRRRSLLPLAMPTALSILSNWYTGGINCLFCIFWLVFEFFMNECDPESVPTVPESNALGAGKRGLSGIACRFIGTVVRYGIAMVIGIAISAVLFLPTISALQMGRGSGFYLDSHLKNVFIGNIWDTVSQYRIDGSSSKSAVSLYCGSLAVIGAFNYFLSRRVRIRSKIISAALMAATLMTFYWQPLFFAFSLFKEVYSYYSRYGYIGSLVLLFLSAMYLQHVFPSKHAVPGEVAQNGELKKAECLLPLISSVIFCVLLFTVGNHPFPEEKGAWLTCICMLGAGALIVALLTLRSADRTAGRRLAAGVISVLLVVISAGELFLSGNEAVRYNRLKGVDHYSAYVSGTKEQVAALKAYDNGLYRISQIGWREAATGEGHTACYNDALAYNYMGIGGYTSSPENDQMYFLERLGYKEDNKCMNIVNTSFVPADSMLGVRYVFSDIDIPGLEKIAELGEYNGKATYSNPCAFPLAFVYDGAMLPSHKYHNPFEYLEEIWTALSGEEANIFTELEAEKKEIDGGVTWNLKIPDGNIALYGDLPSDEWNPATLQPGTGSAIGYAQWLSPTVFLIPYEEGAESVDVTLTYKKAPVLEDELFYALDLDRLKELSVKISKGAEQVSGLTMENGKMSCTVTAHEGDRLFLTLPRTKGWNTSINGEKVDTEEFAYCLTVIPLKEGENHIERFYRIPNLRRGTALTIAGILFLAVYECLIRRGRAGKK